MDYQLLCRSYSLTTAHYQKRNGIDKRTCSTIKYMWFQVINYVNINSGLKTLNQCVHKQPKRKRKGGGTQQLSGMQHWPRSDIPPLSRVLVARPPRSPPLGKPLWIMGRPRPPIAPLARAPMGRPNRAWMLLLPRRCFKLFWKKRRWGIEIKKSNPVGCGNSKCREKEASEMSVWGI